MADNRSVSVHLRADVSGYVASIEKAKLATKDFANSATKNATDHKQSWDKVGKGMLVTGGILAVGVGLAVKAYADFSKEMSGVQAVSGANAKQMDMLGKAAIKAGADTVFSASEAAKAEGELAKAGVSTADILGGALTGSLNLASAGGLDLADAATIAAQTMNIFGLKGKDVSHIADTLAAGANKSAADVGSLGDALKQGGLVAAQTGLHLEDTVGVLSMFADKALVGSDAGTSLKTMLMRLVPQSDAAAGAMESIGFNAYDASGKFVGMESVAQQLKTGLGGLTEQQRSQTLTTIFGSDATRAASILYSEGAAGVKEYTAAVNDNGAAQRMASVQLNNMSGDFEQLKGSIDTALIQSGSAANGVLRSLLQGATGVVNAFGGLPAPLQQGALGLGAVASAGLLAGGAFLTVVPKILAAKTAMRDLGIAAKLTKVNMLAFATGPIGLAIGAITIAVGLFAKSQMDAKAKSDELRDSLDQQTGAITDQTRVLVAKQLQEDGSLRTATSLGISHKLLTDAYLGQADAAKQLLAMQLAAQHQSEATTNQAGIQANGTNLLTGSTNLFANATNSATDVQARNSAATVAASQARAQGIGALLASAAPVASALGAQSDAEREVAAAAGTATTGTKGLSSAEQAGAAAAEDNKKAHDALTASIASFGSTLLTARGDARSYEAAIDAATAAVKANGKTLDIGTEKGRANQAALDGISSAALKAAESTLTNAEANGTLSTATKGVTDKVGSARAAFIKAAMSMGMNKKAASELATQSGLTAGRVQGITDKLIALGKQKPTPKADVDKRAADAKIKAMQGQIDAIKQGKKPGVDANTAAGKKKIADLQAQILALKGKNVSVDVSFNTRTNSFINKPPTWGPIKRAGGGPITGTGGPTQDNIPVLGSVGEFMVNAKAYAKHAPLVNAINANKLAAGGPVVIGMPSGSALTGAMNSAYPPMPKGGFSFNPAAFGGGAGGAGGAAKWSSLVVMALTMLGQSASWLPAVLARINQESGGNPKAINLTDSNAKAGHPSQGLMQTIPGTFAAYAGPFAGRGITDPFASIYAGLNYAVHRYGSLAVMTRPGGYDTGGMLPPGGIGKNYGKRPERVLSASQTDSFERLVALLSSGSARQGSPAWAMSADGDPSGGSGSSARGGTTNNTTTFNAYGLDADRAIQKAMRDWEFAAVPR